MASPNKRRSHKRKRESELDDVEKTLIERLQQLKKPQDQDDAVAFGNHVATRLRTFTPRQYVIACLQIEKVLVDIQFPPSHDHDPYSTSSVPPQHTSDYYNLFLTAKFTCNYFSKRNKLMCAANIICLPTKFSYRTCKIFFKGVSNICCRS